MSPKKLEKSESAGISIGPPPVWAEVSPFPAASNWKICRPAIRGLRLNTRRDEKGAQEQPRKVLCIVKGQTLTGPNGRAAAAYRPKGFSKKGRFRTWFGVAFRPAEGNRDPQRARGVRNSHSLVSLAGFLGPAREKKKKNSPSKHKLTRRPISIAWRNKLPRFSKQAAAKPFAKKNVARCAKEWNHRHVIGPWHPCEGTAD